MPRPGPRPYECVRRTWHSDRHQPIRGSIIQQLFRLVNESHNPRTKKNREWQEKLPIVVFRAEEIMYSKANSEAEYMDPETLWERVNDAIDTIIRKDENTETGELLQPCIEAALSLGCIPVKASRSQRHSNPRTYLTPTSHESTLTPPRVLELARSTPVNSDPMISEGDRHVTVNHIPNAPRSFPFLYENLPSRMNQSVGREPKIPSKLGSVYPLYYGTHSHSQSQNENNDTIFVGTPVGTSISASLKKGVLQNLFISDNAADIRDTCQREPEVECDLSLRLGLSSNVFMGHGKNLLQEIIEGGSKSIDLSSRRSKEICLFPGKMGFDTFESSSNRWDSTLGKRKMPLSDSVDDQQFFWQPELQSNKYVAQTKWPGL